MPLLKPKKSDKVLKKILGPINNCQEAVDQFLIFFETYPVKEVKARIDEDMLLFQYGTYNWDKKGPKFEFNLTRQFEIPNQDEYLQLSLTLYYAVDTLQQVEAFNTWSMDYKDLKTFKKKIESSDGFQNVLMMKPLNVKITLSGT